VVRPNGLRLAFRVQNASVQSGHEPPRASGQLSAREGPETTVLIAVESARVREALVAMLGALDGFRVVAEADTDDAALEAARRQRPHLALIEAELSGCGGWWAIQQMQSEQLVGVVVALGRRADGTLAQLAGAQSYVQMGTSPRDLLSALEAAMAYRTPPVSGAAQTEQDLLPDADAVVEKPAFVDF
jgi:DNA-binding NarL/FixJ family response regulator